MITGEPAPVSKTKTSKVIAGTLNTTGSFLLHAENVGNETLLARMIELVNDAGRSRAPIQKLADKVSSWFVPVVIFVAIDGLLTGIIGIGDAIKKTTAQAIKQLHQAGLKIVVLTGDNSITAKMVAKTLGLDDVKADTTPEDKLNYLKALQQKGHIVAMAGDGINDAPALAKADVGIAMGTGTDVAMNSARVVLVKGDLRGITKARLLSQHTNIRQNLFFAFIYNFIGVSVAAGILYPWF